MPNGRPSCNGGWIGWRWRPDRGLSANHAKRLNTRFRHFVRVVVKTRLHSLLVVLLLGATLTSCTTAYDAYGRPQQVVTPEGAVLGAAAAGLLAYSLANNNNDRHYRGHYRRSPYRSSGYHRGHWH